MNPDTSIEFLKGIGADRAALIRNTLGIRTVEDLLNFSPLRYLDKSKVWKVAQLQPTENLEVQLQGRITNLRELGEGRTKRLAAKFHDDTGTMDLVWFKYSKWMLAQVPQDRPVYVFGKITVFNQVFSMAHPEIELEDGATRESYLELVYPGSEKLAKRGINQKFFRNIFKALLPRIPEMMPENLPDYLRNSLKLMPRPDAYAQIHFPNDAGHLAAAEKRLKFEEAFYFQLNYGLRKRHHKSHSVGNPFPIVGDYFTKFYNEIMPFELTSAQKKVLKEIRTDMRRPIQMNRLLQGDVGSGKTIVALLSMLVAMDNGFQSVMMAPTEILAQQHYNGIRELLKDSGIAVKLLTGSTRTAERRIIHRDLQSGELPILIGTHAVLEDVVKFNSLGLAIIDEQHRFGVAQRAKLWAKNRIPPHILVMTATPIPRTLAMSFYSDLDVSVIDELPAGRKPIITAHRREKDRLSVYNFAKDEIRKGRQIYFVYPLIEESETLDYRNLMEGLAHTAEFFAEYNVTMVHGRMKPEEKDRNMQYFASGEAQVLVATTVIEVGVNVPNASVMIIESAERFGLSQLHQLRGRVGRGAEQSYCILMTSDKLSTEARTRIRTMCETNDGFKISEVDMQLRGPGDILGTQQSGITEFKKLDLVTDGEIIKKTKDIVEKLLAKDPKLTLPENRIIREFYQSEFRGKNRWGKIS